MRRHSSSDVLLTPRRRRPNLYPFRTVILNGFGWSLLLGAAVVAGGAVEMMTGYAVVGIAAGGAVILSAVGADRLRSRNSWLSIRVESDQLARRIVGLLAGKGIEARAESLHWDDEEEVEHSVHVRQRDAESARAAREQMGNPS